MKSVEEDRIEDEDNRRLLTSNRATNTENFKQLKSMVTTNSFIHSGCVSKPMILFKSFDFYSFMFDNVINIEFNVEMIKK